MNHAPAAATAPASAWSRIVTGSAALLLLAALLAAHGWSLTDGTVLDDHWHQRNLREHGWSLGELLRSTRIEPAEFIHCWWQERVVCWEYLRPVFIFCMKAIYFACGNDPWGLHLFSIVLHTLSTGMVWRLAQWLSGANFWSWLAALLFAIYPHASMTVAWSSSQNAVLQTTLTLAALCSYLAATRLPRSENQAPRLPRSAGAAQIGELRNAQSAALNGRYLALAALFWIVALFTRENALMLPVICAALELTLGGWERLRRRIGVYLTAAAIGVAFVVCRVWLIRQPMPDVYVRRPEGDWPEYLAWCAAKLLHYVCTSIWLAPMTVGPTGRYNPWLEAPADCALMLGIVGVLGGGYWLAARRHPTYWVWPLWILLAVLPVTPVIATPHSGYLGGVGFALAALLACTTGGATQPRWPRHLARAFVLLIAAGMGVLSMFNRWQWTGIIAAEKYVPEWVAVAPPARDAQHVFFINLPFVNVYCKQPLIERLGPWFDDVRVHALTFAPQPVMIEERTFVEQLDERRLRVEIEGQAYFSRLLGRFLIEGFRGKRPFETGQIIRGDEFDVQIERADDQGVHALTFTFRRPLHDAAYAFYLGSPACGAARLRFLSDVDRAAEEPMTRAAAPPTETSPAATQMHTAQAPQTTEQPIAIDPQQVPLAIAALRSADIRGLPTLFAALHGDDPLMAAGAEQALRPFLAQMASMLGARAQQLLDSPGVSAADWRRIERWCRAHVTQAVVDRTLRRLDEFNYLVELREEVPHARMWAALVIRSDLYLTGPPFANLRRPRRD